MTLRGSTQQKHDQFIHKTTSESLLLNSFVFYCWIGLKTCHCGVLLANKLAHKQRIQAIFLCIYLFYFLTESCSTHLRLNSAKFGSVWLAPGFGSLMLTLPKRQRGKKQPIKTKKTTTTLGSFSSPLTVKTPSAFVTSGL